MLGHGGGPDGAGGLGSKSCSDHPSLNNKTNSPGARKHDNLGLLDSFRDEVFDDLTDNKGSHECVLGCEER